MAPQPAAADDLDAIRQLMRQISAAWQARRLDELGRCFHEDVVLVGPGFRELARGRPACMQSYRDFLAGAAVRAYRESEPAVHARGDTAVASHNWEMTYEMNGQVHHETGEEVFVFARAGREWRAVWRAVLLAPRSWSR